MKTNPRTLLTKPITPLPQHRILARLNGEWKFESDWYFDPPTAVAVTGLMLNTGIMGGHFVESRFFYDDCEISRVTFGFDPAFNHFTAFGITPGSARTEMEYGHYDREANALRFSCEEFAGKNNQPILVQRTILFISRQAINMQIDYPEREPEKRLGALFRLRRVGGKIN
jgi:hypothetical protein